MSASKIHYRLCKDFMNVAFRYYQLDNFVGGIDCTSEVDPDDIDEVFSLTPPVLQTASDFAVSLRDVMESDEIEAPVKNMAAFLASVVQHWADTARMAESAFRNLLIRQERSNIDENLAILDQMVEDFDDESVDEEDDLDDTEDDGSETEESEDYSDEESVEDVPEDDSDEDGTDVDEADEQSEDDVSDVYEEAVEDASEMQDDVEDPQRDDIFEEVSQDAEDAEADSDAVSDVEEVESEEPENTEEYEAELFTQDRDTESYGVIEREEASPYDVVPDDEDETPEAPEDAPVDKTEKRYSLEEVKRIITNEDPIPVEIVPDVAEYYSKKVVVDDIVRSAASNTPGNKVEVASEVPLVEGVPTQPAVPTIGPEPYDHPQRIDIGPTLVEAPEDAPEAVEEKPKRGLRGLGRSKSTNKSTKPKEKKTTGTGATRRPRKKKTEDEGGEQ